VHPVFLSWFWQQAPYRGGIATDLHRAIDRYFSDQAIASWFQRRAGVQFHAKSYWAQIMRKFCLYILLCLILLTPTRLWAVELTPYLSLFPLNPLKISSLELTNAANGASAGEAGTKIGLGFFGAVGLMFDKKFGVELEAGFAQADLSSLDNGPVQGTESDKFDMTTGMVNVFYRTPGTLHSSDIYTLHYYFGGGLGMTKQNLFVQNLTQGNDTTSAWQLFLGIELAPTHRNTFLNGSLLLQYKYFSSGEGQFGSVLTDADMHAFSLGVRFF